MSISLKLLFAAFLYLVLTLVLLFFTTPHALFSQKLHPFYQDPTISDRVHIAIISNPNGAHALFTRIFHNKIAVAGDNLVISLARSTDPVFFFSLFTAPYYGDSYYFFTFPIYFPLFLVGAFVLLRSWNTTRKKYFWLWILALVSLCIDVLFLPYTAPLKLIPLFITVQLMIFFGWYELAQTFMVRLRSPRNRP